MKQAKIQFTQNKVSKTSKTCFTNTKREKGITLIALVVTIIVLLILAGVTINIALGDNGIFEKAKESQEKMNEAVQNDMEGINYLNDTINKYQDGTISKADPDKDSDGEKISSAKSYTISQESYEGKFGKNQC